MSLAYVHANTLCPFYWMIIFPSWTSTQICLTTAVGNACKHNLLLFTSPQRCICFLQLICIFSPTYVSPSLLNTFASASNPPAHCISSSFLNFFHTSLNISGGVQLALQKSPPARSPGKQLPITAENTRLENTDPIHGCFLCALCHCQIWTGCSLDQALLH